MGGNIVETLIGAAVLAVAGIFIAFGYSTSSIGTDGGLPLTAKFDRVDGLVVGSDVRMSGIKIGTVTDLQLDPVSFRAIVRLDLNPNLELSDDTSASITSEGLLGDTYLSLEAGNSEEMLKPEGEIRATQGTIDLISLIRQAVFSATGKTEEKK